MKINLKRIYQAKENSDGFRILVDKIYPRGIKKENLDVDLWDKEIAPSDALRIMQLHAADMVNIKLMKCGGLYPAQQIIAAAEIYGMECMLGCMLEAKISVNAAVALACAKKIVTRIDLDGPVLCREDPIEGGAQFNEKDITASAAPGLGIKGVAGLKML